MTQLSSRLTFFHKLVRGVFVYLWFGLLVIVLLCAFISALIELQWLSMLYRLVMLLILTGIGYLAIKNFCKFHLVDQVWDCGDSILVINGKYQQHFAFTQLRGVFDSKVRDPTATILLHEIDPNFGSKIVFIPHFRLLPYWQHPVVANLRAKITAAQKQTVGHYSAES